MQRCQSFDSAEANTAENALREGWDENVHIFYKIVIETEHLSWFS